jgi:disulfide oxidoreductase YuzD
MGTPFLKVYDAFLARITADEWTLEEELAIVERDWQELLKMAIFRFKYPRVSLDVEEIDPVDNDAPQLKQYQFVEELTNDEIQILALFMKHEWIKRCIASWENIRQLYADKDFSQANHLDKLLKLEKVVDEEIHVALGIYDRSREKRPSLLFKKLAGKKNALRT